MFPKPRFASLAIAFLTCLPCFNFASLALAQTAGEAVPMITQGIDESKLVTLKGNTRPETKPGNDRGPIADSFPIEHILLQLRRSPEREQELKQFIDELHNPDSLNFHQWLTAQQFGERFGLAKQDLDTIIRWLESHGFTVNVVYPSGIVIDFSGTAGHVRAAFHTEIHQLEVDGVKHIANMRDPQIPAALAPAVSGIVSLHDFRPRPTLKIHGRTQYTFSDALGNTNYAVVPGDLATIYNFKPLFSSGISGQGQTIALIEDGDLFSKNDWDMFRSTFGLTGYAGSLSQVHPAPPSGPNNCSDPGVVGTTMNPVDAEATLDAEYATAAAPSAAVQIASCSDTGSGLSATFGGLIAIQNLINTNNPPPIMSISYGECEAVNGSAANSMYNMVYQQADAEGVSVYVAAGDSGGAGCDQGQTAATSGIAVNAFASTPYNVAVGGTDFGDTYAATNATYWNSSNPSNYSSALSYISEIPWNDSCTSALMSGSMGYPVYGPASLCNSYAGLLDSTAAGSGGPSGCATGSPTTSGVVSGTCAGYAKPSWQRVFGNPCGSNCGSATNDTVRDIPDVSLFAAAGGGLWFHYYIFCFSDPADGGVPCTGAPSGWAAAGGTSFASPIMAGVQALINQKTGSRQGNPNPVFYSLANTEYGSSGNPSCNSSLGNAVSSSCIFHDVTFGDMAVNCGPLVINNQSIGVFNCFDSADGDGVLSTSNTADQPAYGTATGWDFATGIGSVNVANLVNSWPNLNPALLSITKTHTGNFTQGQQNATYTVTVSNGMGAGATNGTVTVTETLPPGLTLVSMAGTGWTCGANNCTRSDALNGGSSYVPITVAVNVVGNASSPQANQVTVSGGGSAAAGASDSTTIIQGSGNGNGGTPSMLFVPVVPCRVADTRNANGAFGGPSLNGGTSRSFSIPKSACGIPSTAAAYSLNVTVVPHQSLSYLTAWPTGQSQPFVSTINSTDGRIKANAAIVPAGTGGAINVFATDATDVVLDINGYFVPTTVSGALAFYPLTPCRLVDTRLSPGALAAPSMTAGQTRSFPLLSSSCNIPSTAQAYSLNFTAVPDGPLSYLTVWPTGQMQPLVSTLNAPTGTITANAAIVPAGSGGAFSLYVTNKADMVIDINGYFAPPAAGGLSFFALAPCRVLDTRSGNGQPFTGTINVDVTTSNCGVPSVAQAYVFNATVVPSSGLNYLTLWPQNEAQPFVSTLNATDGTITSNMAIVPTISGSISAYATSPTQLILDIFGYFAQ